jgi:adenylate cyclase class 2
MSHIEYEVRVLNIDTEEMINTLEKKGATLVEKSFQRRYVYDLKPVDPNRWIRLRTNGKKTTLAIKQQESANIDGTREMEIEVNDFDETNEILKTLGYVARGVQENYRMRYDLDGVEVDIDQWPHIPPFLEIEGKNAAEVYTTLDELGIDVNKSTCLGVMDIYKQVYKIPNADKDLAFTDDELSSIKTIEENIESKKIQKTK